MTKAEIILLVIRDKAWRNGHLQTLVSAALAEADLKPWIEKSWLKDHPELTARLD